MGNDNQRVLNTCTIPSVMLKYPTRYVLHSPLQPPTHPSIHRPNTCIPCYRLPECLYCSLYVCIAPCLFVLLLSIQSVFLSLFDFMSFIYLHEFRTCLLFNCFLCSLCQFLSSLIFDFRVYLSVCIVICKCTFFSTLMSQYLFLFALCLYLFVSLLICRSFYPS